MTYEETPIKPSKKKDLMVISEMSSAKIVRFLTYKHRVGLLSLGNIVCISYIAWSKVLHIFF